MSDACCVGACCGVGGAKVNDATKSNKSTVPFAFDDDGYEFPTLYQEADEMLQLSLLIYTITALRSLAKNKKYAGKLKNPERILKVPLTLHACIKVIEENKDLIKKEFGDTEQAMTASALESLENRPANDVTACRVVLHFFASLTGRTVTPVLTAYGDDKPDTELVYAVGVDPVRKRVTVAFRGSVTPADFMTDAMIDLIRQDNPVKGQQDEKIGIHRGFYDYLIKERKVDGTITKSKYDEVLEHIVALFRESSERQRDYKLYVTGHSLGGALATLFSFHVAALVASAKLNIPSPVSCVSVASPRVGDESFRDAFNHLEETGFLRHLRIANKNDPVTMMPKLSVKKMWAMAKLYVGRKDVDSELKKKEDKEVYYHTGMKLKLQPGGVYDITYSGRAKEEDPSSAKEMIMSFTKSDIPDVSCHTGKAYTDNLANVRADLSNLRLNDLYIYKTKKVTN